MARPPVNQDVANSVIGESLGLNMQDLGADREDVFANLDLGDDDDGDIGSDDEHLGNQGQDDFGADNQFEPVQRQQPQDRRQPKPQNQQPPLDDLSVSHTAADEFKTIQGKPKFDAKGNILAPDGKIVARAGSEARMYTTLHKRTAQLTDVTTRANTEIGRLNTNLQKAVEIGTGLGQQLAALQQAGTAHTRLGLTDSDHQQALELAVLWKRSPVEAVKTILTRASASGIDMTTLGLQPGGFDTKALLDLIQSKLDTAVKPIQDRNVQETAQQTQERERLQAVDNAKNELSQFIIQNPEARNYLPVFEKIYSDPRYANMPLTEVWLRIQLNRVKMSGDQRNQNPDNQNPRLRNRQPPRLPNGRQNPPGGGGRQQPDQLAPVDMSYEDILRGVMAESGN